ncbi:hypothetical protein HYFRA_00009531 [Hymenoscyphus fraxineus]|uniref:RGS domain-containing protein n=1 Tax=Hymenoscyphus fraxineus TaxID=746836 RepID=A0A9N9L0X7_9HELO|nr:hypothetical protein HYFRA_00009531 [Hymenoscyphus fraxineus]
MKYLRTAMRRAKHRKPPSLYLYTSSRDTSPRCSSVLSDWDADDEGFMSTDNFPHSRPLSLAIPNGSYCSRKPTLQEVLSNVASPPWTLSAFMAYLSQNHCLETLEFTMDAKRYSKHYREMADRDPLTPLSPQSPECEYVRMLWQKLLDAYIVPNGPREVNLPSNVRDQLVSLPCTYTPPDPTELDAAVKIIYELMEDSVLVPFVNSVAPARSSDSHPSPWTSDESMTDTYMTGSLDERSLSPAQSRRSRNDSPPIADVETNSPVISFHGLSPRISHHSHLSANLSAAFGRGSRLSAPPSGSSATSSSEVPDVLTDDSTDSPSPSGSTLEPMTPPNTPPTSNTGFNDPSPGTSPRVGRGEGMGWKKIGSKFGFKKSRSANGSNASNRSSSPHAAAGKEATSPTVIAPMEHPVVGLKRSRGVHKDTALLHGGTSLKLSEGDSSPVLEAHPGSPVEISENTRPSHAAASLSQRLYHGSDAELAKFERKARMGGKREDSIRREGMAAKGFIFRGRRDEERDGDKYVPNRRMQVAGPQPFFIPAKIYEHEEIMSPGVVSPGIFSRFQGSLEGVQSGSVTAGSSATSTGPSTPMEEVPSILIESGQRLSIGTEMAMQYDFKTENGVWISANPVAMESRSSLATTSTYQTTSTVMDDRMSMISQGALTVDTSVASSSASMMSSIDSIQSATTVGSADIYGWEEELDRKETIESTVIWERELQRRLPSGGRTFGPRSRVYDSSSHKGKRKSLLYRVLNLHGSRRGLVEEIPSPLASPTRLPGGNSKSTTHLEIPSSSP